MVVGGQVKMLRPGNCGSESCTRELNLQAQEFLLFCCTTNHPMTRLADLLMPIQSAWLITDRAMIQVRAHTGKQGVGAIALPGTTPDANNPRLAP